MKTIIKEITKILTITLLAMMVTSCNNDDDAGANLSFSRSIYVLPATGSLNIELKASVAPENDLIVPITIDGSAVLDDEYEISAKEFIIKAGETNAQITITPKNNLAQGKEIRIPAFLVLSKYGLKYKVKLVDEAISLKQTLYFH